MLNLLLVLIIRLYLATMHKSDINKSNHYLSLGVTSNIIYKRRIKYTIINGINIRYWKKQSLNC